MKTETTNAGYVRIPTAIHAVIDASPSPSRYAPDTVAVYAAGDEALVAATDGRALAIVPTVAPGASGISVLPSDAVRSSRATHRKARPSCVGLDAAIDDATFPPIDVTLPNSLEGTVAVQVNAALLAALAKSIGSDGPVTLLVRKGKPSIVIPHGDIAPKGAFGVLAMIETNETIEGQRLDAQRRIESARAIVNAAKNPSLPPSDCCPVTGQEYGTGA